MGSSAFTPNDGMPATARLLAKLTRPRLHGAVARGRLFAQLDEARGRRPAICIVGPPGAGKTTLAASWLDARGAKGIWYQVDAGDTDLATFFHYLGQAAKPFKRKAQPPLPALTPEYLNDVAGFSRRFFRELFSRLPDRSVLVLDNYQEIASDQPFHGLIAEAVAEVPAGLVLVALSRRDPPDTYARLIANEDVAFVDWDQLKLTLEEAGEIASARTSIDAAEIERLHATSGGWAAGLTLLLEGRRRNAPASTDVPEGRDAIFDYFAAQIFARVPETTQRFLVATAFLPQVPVSIARELTGNEAADAILDDLYRRHLFTHRRPGAEPVYWYHALFRTFLKAQAGAVLGTDRIAEILSRAARLLEAGGMFDDAFELFREARDWTAAERLIERRAADLLDHGRGQTLREWIQVLPPAMLIDQPRLLYWLGTSLVSLDQVTARTHLEQAFSRFHAAGETFGQALCAAGIIDAYVFEWAEFQPVRRWVDALEGLIDRVRVADSPTSEQRMLSSLLLGMLYVAPDHPRLPWCVARVSEIMDEDLAVGSKLAAAMMLLAYCNLAWDVERSIVVAARGNALVRSSGITPFARLWWQLRLSLQVSEQGRYEEAIAILDEAEKLARANGFHRISNMMSLLWVYREVIAAELGDLRTMQRDCDLAVAEARSGHPMAISNAIFARVYSQCAAGNEEAMAISGIECMQAAQATGMVYLEVLAMVLHAIGLASAGQRAALGQILAVLRARVSGTCFAQAAIDVALIEAWDVMRHEDHSRGLHLLTEALAQGRASRWKSWNAYRLCRVHREAFAEACEAGIEVDFVSDLVRTYRLAPPACATERWPWAVKVRMLGRFEVVVNDAVLEFSGKAPRKPLALLKAIVAMGPTGVPVASLIDALWPDEDGDAGRKSLDVTVARLRKLLGRSDAILVSDEAVTLNPRVCWVDAQSFVALSEAASTPEECRRASSVYGGTFLPGDIDAPWSAKRREGLRNRFIRLVEEVGAHAEEASAWDEAIAWYGRGLEADELAETFHLGLMRCYRALGRHAEGMSAYRRLRQTLSLTLGIAPSEQSQALARALQQDGAPA